MHYEPARIGVCVVRIEHRRSGVFIKLHQNADVEQISTVRTSVTTDIDTAVQAVREFLSSFTAASGVS
jgi:sensor domain CHASE-containing protein